MTLLIGRRIIDVPARWPAERSFCSLVASFLYVCHSHRWWIIGSKTVPHSVLDAIKLGMWDLSQKITTALIFASTQALPGTDEKLRCCRNV